MNTSGHQSLVREGKPVIEPKRLAEAKAARQLDRLAPDWPLHLYDGGIIDHILKVINNPRSSRREIARRYRARRSSSGLAVTSASRNISLPTRQER